MTAAGGGRQRDADAPSDAGRVAGTLTPYEDPARAGSPSEGWVLRRRVAVGALLLNAFVWPGVGSLAARERIGWAQAGAMVFGVALILVSLGAMASASLHGGVVMFLVAAYVGFPILVVTWLWGMVTGIQLLQRSSS